MEWHKRTFIKIKSILNFSIKKPKILAENSWDLDYYIKSDISIEEVKFVFTQAENYLKETSGISDIIVGRTNTLITIVVGLLTALTGYSINRWITICRFDRILVTSTSSSLYLYSVIFYLIWNVKGINYSIIGSEPRKLCLIDFFNSTKDEKLREKMFYLAELHNYQARITSNKLTNEIRWTRYNRTLICVILIPIVLVLLFLVSAIFVGA